MEPDRTVVTVAVEGAWRPEALGRPRALPRVAAYRLYELVQTAAGLDANGAFRLTMFDLRYHVASLAAVFLALVIGILVGVGISSGGFVSKGERSLLNSKIDELQRSLDAARAAHGRPVAHPAGGDDVRRGVVSAADGRSACEATGRARLRRPR